MSEGRDQGFDAPRWRVMIILHGRDTVSLKILPSLFHFYFFICGAILFLLACSASWIALASARSLLVFLFYIYFSVLILPILLF